MGEYVKFRRPDRHVLFAVRYSDGTSAYIRVPPHVGAFGAAAPGVIRMAHEAQARGEIATGEIAAIVRVR